jgi:nucleoside-diphosphate-sugar epimerase
MRRFHEAAKAGTEEVIVWGSGTPRREFLHVDDMADASLHVLDLPEDEYWGRVLPTQSHVNVGSGAELSIAELAQLVSRVTGFEGTIRFDASKPDGAPRKLLDNTLITQLGWRPRIGLEEGLRSTYEWYRTHASAGGT